MLGKVALLLALIAVTFGFQSPRLDGRIVGGVSVTIDEYPHQLSLQYHTRHICGASIIKANIALTAAHCTDKKPAYSLSIRAGSSYKETGGKVVNVAKVVQHPNYNRRTTDFDICLLFLSGDITVGKPIQLAGETKSIPIGTLATVSGWGNVRESVASSTYQLQAVNVPIVSLSTCKAAYGIAAITDRMICAGYSRGGKDACQGDSGGPLIANDTLIGIVSWGYGCARPYYPGVYSSISNLRGWIKFVSRV